MRVQLVDRPRIDSTRTSSTCSRAAASGYRAFQRSRPASASALRAALATVMSGWVDSRWPRRSELGPGAFRLDGGTRRLVMLLLIVRRPRRVSEACSLLRCRQLEECIEGSRRAVDAGRRVAAFRKPRRRGGQRECRRIAARLQQRAGQLSSSRSAFASLRSGVSKPSVNQP